MSEVLIQRICEEKNFTNPRRLNEGAQGTAYLVDSEFWGENIVLKVMHNSSNADLINEVKALAKLKIKGKHRNVAQLYDFKIGDDYSYIATEFVQGKNLLEERLTGMGEDSKKSRTFFPMDRKTLIYMFEKISSGVEFIHSAGVVHNDLKLDNIIMDENGDLKIVDLGLADLRGRAAVIYGAPEIVSKNIKPTTMSDVYELGILFYYLATGHPPYSTGNWEDYSSDIVAKKRDEIWEMKKRGLGPTQIRELEDKVGKNISKFIARMLDPDPSRRPKDAKAVHKFFAAKKGFIVNRKHMIMGGLLFSLFAGYKYGDNQGWFDSNLETQTLIVKRPGNTEDRMQRDIYYYTESDRRPKPLIETGVDEYDPRWIDDGFFFKRGSNLFFKGYNFEKKIIELHKHVALYAISPNGQHIAYTKKTDEKPFIYVSEIDKRKNLKHESRLGILNGPDVPEFSFITDSLVCYNNGSGLVISRVAYGGDDIFAKDSNSKTSVDPRTDLYVKDKGASHPVYVKDKVTGEETLYYVRYNLEKRPHCLLLKVSGDLNIKEIRGNNDDETEDISTDFVVKHFEPRELESPRMMTPFH